MVLDKTVLDSLLQARGDEFPKRGIHYQFLQKELDQVCLYYINNFSSCVTEFSPSNELIETAEKLCKKAVFVGGAMKSGTTLMSKLMDGHPNLHVMPGDSRFVSMLNDDKNKKFNDVADYWIRRLINPTAQAPFYFLKLDEINEFLQYLKFFLKKWNRPTFVCVVISILLTKYKDNSSKIEYWVEKTTGNPLDTDFLHSLFPEAKFIQVVREPLSNVNSLLKFYQVRGVERSAASISWYVRKLLKAGIRNEMKLGSDKYKIIRYEDIIADPESTMLKISGFLDVEYSKSMLVPSIGGEPAISNSMYSERRVVGKLLKSPENISKLKMTDVEYSDSVLLLSKVTKILGYESRFIANKISGTFLGAYKRIILTWYSRRRYPK